MKFRMRGIPKEIAAALLLGVALPLAAAKSIPPPVRLGVDILQDTDFAGLEGASVGLITNQTGFDSEGQSTVDVLAQSQKIKLRAIFSPEHGFKGALEHGQSVNDEQLESLNVPIYSLYGPTKRPTAPMLEGVDTLVFDMQDIGTRFYTYITTMGMAMEEAARLKIRFVVLDRPNPIRGDIREGDILDADIKRMTGYFQIPVRHGLTVGEIAHWMNESKQMGVNLTVVKMTGWSRTQWFDETAPIFRPPSPNIPTLTSALLYPGVGCFEASNISVGRGTPQPFEQFGAPWINGKTLTSALRSKKLPGVAFNAVKFTPTKDIYQGEVCEGVRIVVKDRDAIRPFEIFIHAFLHLQRTHPNDFAPDWEEVRVVTGSAALKEAVDGAGTETGLLDRYRTNVMTFDQEISPYLLY